MLHRFPKGLAGDKVHQKRLPAGAPEWVETVQLFFPRWKRTADEASATARPCDRRCRSSTVHAAPWTACSPTPRCRPVSIDPDRSGVRSAPVRVGRHRRRRPVHQRLVGFPKTSGGLGMHVYVRIPPDHGFQDVRRGALAFAREVERRAGGEVTTAWWRKDRDPSQLFVVDYNQNARDHTIAAAYSVRACPRPGCRRRSAGTRSTTACPTTSPSSRCPSGSRRSATCTPASTTSRSTSPRCSSGRPATRTRARAAAGARGARGRHSRRTGRPHRPLTHAPSLGPCSRTGRPSRAPVGARSRRQHRSPPR